MNCDKFCTDITGFYGEYDKGLLGKGKVEWYNPGHGFSPCCGASGPVTKEDGSAAKCADVCLDCDQPSGLPGTCCSTVCGIPGYEYCCNEKWDQYCACKAKEKCCECPKSIQGPPVPDAQACGICSCNYYICANDPKCTGDTPNVQWSCFDGNHPYGMKEPEI